MTLPNFMIIGVAKAGTTSLFRYLDQHPQIFMCPIKGSNYFGYEDARDWRWTDEGEPPMLRNFPIQSFDEFEALFDGVTNEIAIGEVSPQYFRCPTAANRIYERLPNIKLAAILRNPADRAFSGFMMRKRRGEPVKSVPEELTPESSHVREGFYYRRMKRYFDLFAKDQFKIYIFEEFKVDPSKVVVDLFKFLGVDENFVPDTSVRYNPAGIPRNRFLNRLSYDPTIIRTAKTVLPESLQRVAKNIRLQTMKSPPKFPPELRDELLSLYKDDILKLEELIDLDLSIWLKPRPQNN